MAGASQGETDPRHTVRRLRTGEFRSVVIREESKVVVLRITARKDFERVLKTL